MQCIAALCSQVREGPYGFLSSTRTTEVKRWSWLRGKRLTLDVCSRLFESCLEGVALRRPTHCAIPGDQALRLPAWRKHVCKCHEDTVSSPKRLPAFRRPMGINPRYVCLLPMFFDKSLRPHESLCPVGALAHWLFSRNHCRPLRDTSALLDVSTLSSWTDRPESFSENDVFVGAGTAP